ncbi:hypothetical protein OAC89_03250 [Deltaproteobacteria bacterium]|nr:hypothetical protein [Deltaproteobacteria bacterium]
MFIGFYNSISVGMAFLLFISMILCTGISSAEVKKGEYLREDYIDIIEKTHSPSIAFSELSGEPTLIRAYQGEYDLVLIHNFHEFYDGLDIMEDGKFHRTAFEGGDPSNITVTVDGDNLIMTDYDTEGPLHYVYVGDAQRYAAKKVIVGDYVDSEGKTYSFKEDGTALFGDVQFQYEIGLDFVLRPKSSKDNNKRDCFQNSKSRELFEYEIKGGVMSIYRTSGQESMDVEPEPFLKIKKTSK